MGTRRAVGFPVRPLALRRTDGAGAVYVPRGSPMWVAQASGVTVLVQRILYSAWGAVIRRTITQGGKGATKGVNLVGRLKDQCQLRTENLPRADCKPALHYGLPRRLETPPGVLRLSSVSVQCLVRDLGGPMSSPEVPGGFSPAAFRPKAILSARTCGKPCNRKGR